MATSRPLAQPHQSKPESSSKNSPMGMMSLPIGLVTGMLAAARLQKTRVGRRAGEDLNGPPSLIQVLEKKKLLSTAENLGLLSAAENAGLTVGAVEQSGLLMTAEQGNLLTKAEALVTSPSTPTQLLAASAFLGLLTYLDVSGQLASLLTGLPVEEELGLVEQILAVLLGLPAVVFGVAGLAIANLFGGVQRSKPLTSPNLEFDAAKGFYSPEDVTLLKTVENNKLLSFAQKNRLLSLLGNFVDKPLTFAEQQGILSKLESLGLLSSLESQSTKGFGQVGGIGLILLVAAITANFFASDFAVVADLGGVIGLVLLATSVVLGLSLTPARS